MAGRLINKGLIVVLLCIVLISLSSIGLAVVEDMNHSMFYFSKEKGIHTLSGEWDFYHQQLLTPTDFDDVTDINQRERVVLPGDLTKQEDRNGERYNSHTYGTLRANVVVDNANDRYGLKVPYLSSANKIWINGNLVFSSGIVSDQKESFSPQYLPAEIYFTANQKEVEIVAQISNFHHRRVRMNDIYFGTAEDIRELSARKMIKESAISGALFLVGIYYAILFRFKNTDRSALYLSMLSFLVAIRGLILQEKIALQLFPEIPGEFLMKLGFMPVFLFLPLISLYIEDVFKVTEISRMNQYLKRVAIFFIFLVALTPGHIYDFAFDLSKSVFLMLAAYIIFILFSKKYHQTRGFAFMIAGSLLLFITAVNDIFREFDVLATPEMFSYGIFLFIIIQAVFLAWKYNDVYMHSMTLSEENKKINVKLEALNRDLEQKIIKRTAELEESNKNLLKMSRTDSLTGLFNRRYFEIKYVEEWRRCLKEQQLISVIMIDIDHFKEYNDYYGHLQGDNALIVIASEIKKSINGDGNIVGRYGGEEFIILLSGVDEGHAYQKAEAIRANIERLALPHLAIETTPHITVSIGVCSELPKKEKNRTDIVNAADKALYKAKNSGRNRVMTCEK